MNIVNTSEATDVFYQLMVHQFEYNDEGYYPSYDGWIHSLKIYTTKEAAEKALLPFVLMHIDDVPLYSIIEYWSTTVGIDSYLEYHGIPTTDPWHNNNDFHSLTLGSLAKWCSENEIDFLDCLPSQNIAMVKELKVND